jgi:hypothetical protein
MPNVSAAPDVIHLPMKPPITCLYYHSTYCHQPLQLIITVSFVPPFQYRQKHTTPDTLHTSNYGGHTNCHKKPQVTLLRFVYVAMSLRSCTIGEEKLELQSLRVLILKSPIGENLNKIKLLDFYS